MAGSALAVLAALTAAAPPAAAHTARHPRTSIWTDEDAAGFWTEERMADATPPDTRRDTDETAAPPAYGSRSTVLRARTFAGVPTVGVLFSLGAGMRAHRCTASVVHSPRHDLIVTAAHCGTGTHQAFVPMYDRYRDGRHQPYGVWAVTRGWRPAHYRTTGAGTNYDVAFLRVRADARGRHVEDLTGANRLTRVSGYVHRVTVIGYPAATRHHGDRPVICTTRSTRLRTTRQMRILCGGFYGGTSGAPWLTAFDPRTGTGELIGNIGGRDGGGPDDVISYSPRYGRAVFRLYAEATGTARG
nr:trypsin-like peptidase domain-containing protein [Streptomyces sp. SID5468]